jgi:5-methylcytosine-specific restriction endonuclease McrA
MSTLHRGGQRLILARRRLVERYGYTCGRCGGPIDPELPGTHLLGLTVGHIVPIAHGGTDDDANLRPEHRRCNLAASSRRDPPRASLAVPLEDAR